MRYPVWMVLVCTAVMCFAGDAEGVEVKAAGGLVLDPSRWGGHVSVEIPLGDTYPTYIAPFFELYRKDGVNLIPTGLSLIYKAPFTQLVGTIYFGVGGGVVMTRGTVGALTITDPILGTITFPEFDVSSTDPVITVGGGVRFDLSETLGVFVQTRWFRAFKSNSRSEVALHAGLRFQLGEEE